MSSSLILFNNNEPFLFNNSEPFLDRIVMCDKKWILYNQWWPAQWLDQEEAPKHFPKPNLHPKKVVLDTGGLLPVWSTPAFWILAKPLYLRSVLSKWVRCTENCYTCSQHWATNGPSSSPWQRPRHGTKPRLQKLGHRVLLPCSTSHQSTTTSSSILTAFCRENTAITSRRQKMVSKRPLNPEAWIFILQE